MHPSLDDNSSIPSLLRKAVQSIVRGAGAEGDGWRCVDLLNSRVQLAASLLDYVRTRWIAADSQIEDVTHAEALHILLLVDSIKQRAALLYIEYVQSGCMVGGMVSSCIAEIRLMIGLISPTLSESSSSHDISMLHSIGEACIGPLFDVPCSERSVHSFVVCSKLLPIIVELLHHFRELCPASIMTQHIDIIDSMFFVQWDPAVLLPVAHILSDMYSHLTSQHRRDLRTRLMDAASQRLLTRGGGDSTGLLVVTLRLLEQGCDSSWMHVVRVLYRRSCSCGAGDQMEELWERAFSRSDYAAQLLLCAMEDAAVQCGELLSSRPSMSMSPSNEEDHFVDTVPSISHSDVCLALLISRALKTSRGCSDQCANGEIELPMLMSSVTTDDDYETICQSQHHARTVFVLLLACSAPQMRMMMQPRHRLSDHLSGASSVSSSRLGDIVQYASNDLVAITCSNNSPRDNVSDGDSNGDSWVYCSRSRELFEMFSLLGAYPSIAEECLEKVTGWTTATDTTSTSVLHDEHRSVGCLLRECIVVLFQAVRGTRTAITAAVLRGIIICECAASRPEDGLSCVDVDAKASSREQSAAAAGPAQALLSLFSSLLLQLCRSFPVEIASSHAALRSCLDSLDSVQAPIAHLALFPLVPLCLHSTDLFNWLLGVATRAARDTAMDRQLLAIHTLIPMLFTVDEGLYMEVIEPLSSILHSTAALCSELYTQLLHYLDSGSPPTSSLLGTLKRLVDGQLAASFSSSTHRTSLSLDSDRPNMETDCSVRMQHSFDPALHMKRSLDRWVLCNDIRQLIILSGRVEYCLHGCRYVDPFVRYILLCDDVSRAELTESQLLIAAMKGIVEFIRWGSGTPHDKGGTVDGILSKKGSSLSTATAQCLDRVAGLVCTYAALDAVIYCVVQSQTMCAGDDDDDAAARRDASEALFALSSIADMLINVLAHKTNDEIASHDSCLRSYQSRLGGMADTEHRLPFDHNWLDWRPPQLYSRSRTIVAPSMQLLTRILRNCTTRLLSTEGPCWLSSAAGVLCWPYSLQCGVFNYWCNYITQQMMERGTVEDPSISAGGDADSTSMELLHQFEASYRSVCQIAQEDHWMVFHHTKYQQFLSFVRSTAAERRRYNTRVRSGRRRSCRDTRSDDDMDEEDVDSSSSEGELGVACPLKGFVLSPSEAISPSTTSRIIRDSGRTAHRIVYDCFTNLPPSDRKRISCQYWDLPQWMQCMATRSTDERHAVSGEEDVAAWGAVKQAIKATLDTMRYEVLNAIASVLRSMNTVRCIKSNGELGVSCISDQGQTFLQQSELFSSEILEAVRDGTTARTFNAYVGVLNCLWDRLEESLSALPSAVGRTLMMVLHHLTAPHKLIVRAVLTLAFKFLGLETSLQQIECLICSMTTDDDGECCDSAGHEGRIHPKVVDCILKELLQYVSTVLRDSTDGRSICDAMKHEGCSGALPSAPPNADGVRVLMSLFARSPHSPRRTAKRCLSPQEGNNDDAGVLRIDSLSDNRTLQALDMLVRVMNHCNRECLAISRLALHLRKVTNLVHRSVVKRRNAFDGFRDPFNDDDDNDNGGEEEHEDEEVTSIARLTAVDTRVSCCFVSALFSVPIDALVEMQLWLIRRCTTSRKLRHPKLGEQLSSAQLLVLKRSNLALNKLDALQLNLFTILSEIDKPYHKIPQEDISPLLSDLLTRTYSSEVLAALQVVDVQGRQVLDALQQSDIAGSSSGMEGKQRQKMRSPDVADSDDDGCGSDGDVSTSDQMSADGSSQMKAVADVDRMIEESRRHTYMVGNRRVNTLSPVNIDRLGSPRPTSSISLTGSALRPATKRLRSRNSVIDAWLHEEDGTDAYADLEGFLV